MLEVEKANTIEEAAIPISPSMGPVIQSATMSAHRTVLDGRTLYICALAIVIGIISGFAAQLLIRLIYFFTNLTFFGRISLHKEVAANNHLGLLVIAVPVAGALVIGFMLRYGSRAVAGHGIPEAMEQVLTNESRIPVKMTFLKPLSAAISIGTGGPFGAEGPIIATGGALGSLIGQLLKTTAQERKTLLSAGAAAGIAAAFGCPIAAVLLAVELLLFEFRPRSIIPVAFAAAAATSIHLRMEGAEAVFPITGGAVAFATQTQLLAYTVLGLFVGLGAIVMTRTVYAIEHTFEHVKLHWMWHPALGAVAVGVIGWISPRTLGPGYFNLDYLLSNQVTLSAVAVLCVLKFLSWTISLGSGTAGGTLAPVFTIGGTLGAVMAILAGRLFPNFHLDLRIAALVGMVGIFAGASRALLTSIVFAVETTREPAAALPVLCGCAAAYVVATLLMRHSIMTEKMSRAGVRVPGEYMADFLDSMRVHEVCTHNVVSLNVDQTLQQVRAWMDSNGAEAQHQGYPVVNSSGMIVGVLTRRNIFCAQVAADTKIGSMISQTPIIVPPHATLRDVADLMAEHNVGRIPVVDTGTKRLVGIITRSDLLTGHRIRLERSRRTERSIWKKKTNPTSAPSPFPHQSGE